MKHKTIDWRASFHRVQDIPLDSSSIFNSYEEALNYAQGSSTVAYLGQIVSVIEDDKVEIYKIIPASGETYEKTLSLLAEGCGTIEQDIAIGEETIHSGDSITTALNIVAKVVNTKGSEVIAKDIKINGEVIIEAGETVTDACQTLATKIWYYYALEKEERENADNELKEAISAETQERIESDNVLEERISAVTQFIESAISEIQELIEKKADKEEVTSAITELCEELDIQGEEITNITSELLDIYDLINEKADKSDIESAITEVFSAITEIKSAITEVEEAVSAETQERKSEIERLEQEILSAGTIQDILINGNSIIDSERKANIIFDSNDEINPVISGSTISFNILKITNPEFTFDTDSNAFN